MTGAIRTLHQDLDAFLIVDGEATLPVGARLSYDADDPYAVRMLFRTGDGEVVWTFARDLLLDGMRKATGDGDVFVEPDGEALRLVLTAPTGTAEFALDMFDVAVFLEESTNTVPRGQEHRRMDLDDELRRLLEEAA